MLVYVGYTSNHRKSKYVRADIIHTVTKCAEVDFSVLAGVVDPDLEHREVVNNGCRNAGDDQENGRNQQQEAADVVEEAGFRHLVSGFRDVDIRVYLVRNCGLLV